VTDRSDPVFHTIWKVAATLFLCLLFPFAMLLDLLGTWGQFSEGISEAIRAIWRNEESPN
jgi:hypothetical protein